jgi:hypothetical protein
MPFININESVLVLIAMNFIEINLFKYMHSTTLGRPNADRRP